MVRIWIRFGLALAVPAAFALFAPAALAEEAATDEPAKNDPAANAPTLESLLERIPVLSPENEDLQSFSFTMRMLPVRVQASWERGKDCGLLATDIASGTPIALIRDEKAMVFDVVKGRLLIVEDVRPSFEFSSSDEGKLGFGFGINTAAGEPAVKLDLPSFIRHAGPERKLERQEDGTWHLTCLCKSGESQLTAVFDPALPCPLRSFEIKETKKDSQWAIAVDAFSINAKPAEQLPRFPATGALPPDLPIQRFEMADSAGVLKLIADLMGPLWSSIWGTGAIEAPELREMPLLENVDWDQLARTNRRFGPKLAMLLTLPVPSTPRTTAVAAESPAPKGTIVADPPVANPPVAEAPVPRPAVAEPKAAAAAAAEEMTLASLLEKVPVLSPGNKDLRSFSFTVRHATCRVVVTWEREKGAALLATDIASGTPIMFSRDGRTVIFDIAKPAVLLLEGAHPWFDLSIKDKLQFWLACFHFIDKQPMVQLDLPSLFRGLDPQMKLARRDDDTWLLRGAGTSHDLTGIFDPSAPCPLSSYLVRQSQDGRVVMAIDEVTVNQPVADKLPSFPRIDGLPPGLAVERFDRPATFDAAEDIIRDVAQRISKSSYLIGGLDYAAMRQAPEVAEVDWKKLEETNREFGPALAKWIGKPASRPAAAEADQQKAVETTREVDFEPAKSLGLATSRLAPDRADAPVALGEDVTIESLVSKLPVLTPKNKDLESFAVTARIQTWRIKTVWDRGKGGSLLMTDIASGTPVLFVRDGKALLFDAVASELLVIDGAYPMLDLGLSDGRFKRSFGWIPFFEKEPSIEVDVASLVRAAFPLGTLERQQNDRWRYEFVLDQSRITAVFDPARAYPLESFELYGTDGKLMIAVDEVSINEPLADGFPLAKFSAMEELPNGLDVRQFDPPAELSDAMSLFKPLFLRMGKSVLALGALEDREVRQHRELADVDWEQLARTNREFGPQLAKLVGLSDGVQTDKHSSISDGPGGQTIAKLMETIPLLSPADDDLSSYAFTVRIDGVRIRGTWEREGNVRALLLTVAASETPIAYFRGDSLLLFDALDSSVVIANDGPASFELRAVGEAVEWRIGRAADEPGARPFVVDLPSLVRLLGRRPAIETQADDRWKATSVLGLRRIEAAFDSAAACPLRTLTVRNERTSEPVVVIESLTINEPVAKLLPPFPATADRPAELRVRRIEKFESADERDDLFRRMSESIRALHHVENPESSRPRFLVPVDWDQVARAHRDIGPQLAKLLAMSEPSPTSGD